MIARATREKGFTLIELLVVVAIIALLIAILLPSLSKARKQARTTVCASRISQLTKAIFLYAEDYDETPPFLGMGYESLNAPAYKTYVYGDNQTGLYWAWHEDWLMPNMPAYWLTEQIGWPDYATVPDGTLFDYARFESLYRCPEFERVGRGQKSQEVFNYTRGITCRKCLSSEAPLSDDVPDKLTAGHILKPSQVHSPAMMWMLFDEQWDFHCAIPVDRLDGTCGPGVPAFGLVNFWMGIESIQVISGDVLGSYHGVMGKVLDFEAIQAAEFGSVSYYDGHVGLFRDPLPYRAADMGAPDFGAAIGPAVIEMANIMLRQIFAQRGADVTPDELAGMLN